MRISLALVVAKLIPTISPLRIKTFLFLYLSLSRIQVRRYCNVLDLVEAIGGGGGGGETGKLLDISNLLYELTGTEGETDC